MCTHFSNYDKKNLQLGLLILYVSIDLPMCWHVNYVNFVYISTYRSIELFSLWLFWQGFWYRSQVWQCTPFLWKEKKNVLHLVQAKFFCRNLIFKVQKISVWLFDITYGNKRAYFTSRYKYKENNNHPFSRSSLWRCF